MKKVLQEKQKLKQMRLTAIGDTLQEDADNKKCDPDQAKAEAAAEPGGGEGGRKKEKQK